MRKALFTGLAGLSLLIGIAIMVLWVRSYWVSDLLVRGGDEFTWRIVIEMGRGLFLQNPNRIGGPGPPNGLHWDHFPLESNSSITWFYYERANGHLAIAAPLGLLLPFTLILPILWMIKSRRRHIPGTCRQCGYDLRSTDRCPECGTPIPVAAGNPNDQTRMTNQ